MTTRICRACAELQELSERTSYRLPTASEVDAVADALGVTFHPDFRLFQLKIANRVYNDIRPAIALPPDVLQRGTGEPFALKTVVLSFRRQVAHAATKPGVPSQAILFCQTNGIFSLIDTNGQVFLLPSGEIRSFFVGDLADWIRIVWRRVGFEDWLVKHFYDSLALRNQLFEIMYEKVATDARRLLNSENRRSLQLDTSALVATVARRILSGAAIKWNDAKHVRAMFAKKARDAIVDYRRKATAKKRGFGITTVPLFEEEVTDRTSGDDIEVVCTFLDECEQTNPLLAKIIELHYFGGFSQMEIAQDLDITESDVRKHWSFARANFYKMIG